MCGMMYGVARVDVITTNWYSPIYMSEDKYIKHTLSADLLFDRLLYLGWGFSGRISVATNKHASTWLESIIHMIVTAPVGCALGM